MLHRHKKLLALFTCLIFVFSIVGTAAASPTTIYGTYNGKTALFSFSDLVSAYGNDVAAFKDVWTNTVKTSMTVDGKNVSWSDFIAAVGNGTATTADGYAALPAAVTAPVPATVTPVAASGSVGAEAANPNAPVTTVAISSIAATNGAITPTFAAAAPAGLALADFTVTATLGGAAYTLQSLVFANNAFTFTAVAGTSAEQSLVITVAAAASSTKISGTANATVSIPASVLGVASVSAINGTTIEATLATAKAGAVTADFTVTVADQAVAVTAVAANADNTNYTLTVDLAGKEGTLKVNGTAAVATVDYKKPTISSVQALNNKTLLVTYSEKVAANALTQANYTLYNATTGQVAIFETAGGGTATKIEANIAYSDTTQTAVKICIIAVGGSVTGYPMNGLSNGSYILYVSGVNDQATTANTIVSTSNYQFTGTLTPDSAGPNLISSTFNSGSGVVTLTFDKAIIVAAPADDKVSFTNGTTTVKLKNATDFFGIAGTTSVSFTVDTTAGTGTLAQINALTGTLQVVVGAGAFTDGTNNSTAATSTPTLTQPPVLNSVTYNETTNTALFKFSKTIDVSSITTFTPNKFVIDAVDIQDANLKFNNTSNSTDLSFTLSDVKAQALEAAARGDVTVIATVAAGTVKDTDATPNANVAASSSVTVTIATNYTKDTTAPNLVGAKYNRDTARLEIAFDKKIRSDDTGANTFPTLANVEFYKDDNGTAGLQTSSSPDTKIATFADYDTSAAVNSHGLTAGDLLKSDGTDAAVSDEMTTLYLLNGNTAAVEELGDTLETAIATGKDVYLNIKTGAVKDTHGNASTADKAVKIDVSNVSNSTAVTADTTTVVNNNGSITVQFKNGIGPVAMDPVTASDKTKYNLYLTSNPLNKPAIQSVVMNADNTEATLLLSAPLLASQGYSYTTSGIKTASNVVGDITVAEALLAGAGPDTTALSATQNLVLTDKDASGTANAGDQVAITFNEEIKLPSGFALSTVTVDHSHTLGNATYSLSANMKSLTITLGSSSTIAVGDKLTFPVTIKDLEGNALAGGAGQTTNAMTVTGNTVPVIASTVYTDANTNGKVGEDDTLTVTFDQNIKLATGMTVADLVNDFNLNGNYNHVKSVSLSVKVATVVLNSSSVASDVYGANPKISGTVDDVDIVNVWNTPTADTTGKAVTYSDTAAPTITAFAYKSGTRTLTVSFSEAVNVTSAGAATLAQAVAGKLTPSAGSSIGTIASITGGTLASDGKSFSFVLHTDAIIDLYTTLTVLPGNWTFNAGADFIRDASLNYAIRGQGTAYAITVTP